MIGLLNKLKVESDIRQEVVLVEAGSQTARYELGSGERLSLFAFVLGGGELSVRVDLTGAGAEFVLDALFVSSSSFCVQSGADARISVIVRHLAPDCKSRQLVKGIVGGSDRGEFSGRIYVAEGAQNTDAAQHSRNIQLTDTATVVSRPELEIYADDVRCVHGSTVGRLDEEAIYYMRQRGIDETDARRMQLEGFAMEIVGRLPEAFGRDSASSDDRGSLPELSRTALSEKVSAALASI